LWWWVAVDVAFVEATVAVAVPVAAVAELATVDAVTGLISPLRIDCVRCQYSKLQR
jgi:hypothetical protein